MPEPPDFAEFYGASFGPLCVQLCAHTDDHAEAQDVVQEAFCRALARWHRISHYDDPAAWVRKVAWNLATSRWRKVRANRAFVRREREEHVPEPDAAHLDVIAALKSLPERQRQAVVMHYLSDIPVAEIATITGAAEGTVKSWLHRARTTLDSTLRDAEWPAAIPPGTDTARGTVRRRRDRNTPAIVIVPVCAAVTALLVPYMDFRNRPITEITPSPSAAVSPDPTIGPSADPSAQPAQAGASPATTSASCVSDPVAVTTARRRREPGDRRRRRVRARPQAPARAPPPTPARVPRSCQARGRPGRSIRRLRPLARKQDDVARLVDAFAVLTLSIIAVVPRRLRTRRDGM